MAEKKATKKPSVKPQSATKKTARKPAAPRPKKTAAPKKSNTSVVFAVIETGGKQYRISEGDTIMIERLPNGEEGKRVVFDAVLLRDDGTKTELGEPYIPGAKVEGMLVTEGRGKKINITHFKNKTRQKKIGSHRQPFSRVRIERIA